MEEKQINLLINKTHIIACATVFEELIHMGFPKNKITELELGLHKNPDKLKVTLQSEIDKVDGVENILLGYGLCSYSVVGLSSKNCRLIVPKVDDCISLFLGSNEERLQRGLDDPGIFYLTKGWIKAAKDENDKLTERYGKTKAIELSKMVMSNYTHLRLINTGNYCIDEYRQHALEGAERVGLKFEEIPGSNRILKKMMAGEWDSEFQIVEIGEEIPNWLFEVDR